MISPKGLAIRMDWLHGKYTGVYDRDGAPFKPENVMEFKAMVYLFNEAYIKHSDNVKNKKNSLKEDCIHEEISDWFEESVDNIPKTRLKYVSRSVLRSGLRLNFKMSEIFPLSFVRISRESLKDAKGFDLIILSAIMQHFKLNRERTVKKLKSEGFTICRNVISRYFKNLDGGK